MSRQKHPTNEVNPAAGPGGHLPGTGGDRSKACPPGKLEDHPLSPPGARATTHHRETCYADEQHANDRYVDQQIAAVAGGVDGEAGLNQEQSEDRLEDLNQAALVQGLKRAAEIGAETAAEVEPEIELQELPEETLNVHDEKANRLEDQAVRAERERDDLDEKAAGKEDVYDGLPWLAKVRSLAWIYWPLALALASFDVTVVMLGLKFTPLLPREAAFSAVSLGLILALASVAVAPHMALALSDEANGNFLKQGAAFRRAAVLASTPLFAAAIPLVMSYVGLHGFREETMTATGKGLSLGLEFVLWTQLAGTVALYSVAVLKNLADRGKVLRREISDLRNRGAQAGAKAVAWREEAEGIDLETARITDDANGRAVARKRGKLETGGAREKSAIVEALASAVAQPTTYWNHKLGTDNDILGFESVKEVEAARRKSRLARLALASAAIGVAILAGTLAGIWSGVAAGLITTAAGLVLLIRHETEPAVEETQELPDWPPLVTMPDPAWDEDPVDPAAEDIYAGSVNGQDSLD